MIERLLIPSACRRYSRSPWSRLFPFRFWGATTNWSQEAGAQRREDQGGSRFILAGLWSLKQCCDRERLYLWSNSIFDLFIFSSVMWCSCGLNPLQCSPFKWSVQGLCKNVSRWPAVSFSFFSSLSLPRYLLPKRGSTPHGLGKNSVLRVHCWPDLRGVRDTWHDIWFYHPVLSAVVPSWRRWTPLKRCGCRSGNMKKTEHVPSTGRPSSRGGGGGSRVPWSPPELPSILPNHTVGDSCTCHVRVPLHHPLSNINSC